jgi:RNA polymerase sigma factor (sigma-70 family)
MRKLLDANEYLVIVEKIKNEEKDAKKELSRLVYPYVKDKIVKAMYDMEFSFDEEEIDGIVFPLVNDCVETTAISEKLSMFNPNIVKAAEAKLRSYRKKQLQLNKEVLFDNTSENIDPQIVANDKVVDPDEYVMRQELKKVLLEIIDTLSPDQIVVVRQYFGFDGLGAKTHKEIGDKYNLTRERVRQIVEKALKKIKKEIKIRQENEKDIVI